jgi:predicted  nucleic acid-binding Zn-ribbon protein
MVKENKMGKVTTAQDFEDLKEKIEKAKQKRSKAEGNLERLHEQLKSEFDVETVADAKKLLVNLNDLLEKSQQRLSTILEEIDGLVDWSKL